MEDAGEDQIMLIQLASPLVSIAGLATAVLIAWLNLHRQRYLSAQERRIDLYQDLLGSEAVQLLVDKTWHEEVTSYRVDHERLELLTIRVAIFASRKIQKLWDTLAEIATDLSFEFEELYVGEDGKATVPPERKNAVDALIRSRDDTRKALVDEIRRELGSD